MVRVGAVFRSKCMETCGDIYIIRGREYLFIMVSNSLHSFWSFPYHYIRMGSKRWSGHTELELHIRNLSAQEKKNCAHLMWRRRDCCSLDAFAWLWGTIDVIGDQVGGWELQISPSLSQSLQ